MKKAKMAHRGVKTAKRDTVHPKPRDVLDQLTRKNTGPTDRAGITTAEGRSRKRPRDFSGRITRKFPSGFRLGE